VELQENSIKIVQTALILFDWSSNLAKNLYLKIVTGWKESTFIFLPPGHKKNKRGRDKKSGKSGSGRLRKVNIAALGVSCHSHLHRAISRNREVVLFYFSFM
jgi:hypothetical protein